MDPVRIRSELGQRRAFVARVDVEMQVQKRKRQTQGLTLSLRIFRDAYSIMVISAIEANS